MAEKINAWCSICGKGYTMCSTCADTKTYFPWRTVVDTSEHYKIYMIISNYTNKYVDKSKAKIQLSNVDLTELDTFVPEIKTVIEEIMKDEVIQKEITVNAETTTTKKVVVDKKAK